MREKIKTQKKERKEGEKRKENKKNRVWGETWVVDIGEIGINSLLYWYTSSELTKLKEVVMLISGSKIFKGNKLD